MRWSWIRAALLGLVIGPAPATETVEPSAEPDIEAPEIESAARRPCGHVVRGLDFLVWEEDPREAASWAAELVRSGAQRMASGQWRRVADRSAGQSPVLTRAHEDELERWIEVSRADTGALPLGVALCLLPGLDRTCLISAWATSDSERVRAALASALSAPFEAVGVRGAIDHLRADPNAEVRRLATLAAASRANAVA